MSPTKSTIRFGFSKKVKLRYIGPFDIIAKVCNLAYELVLSPSLDNVHNIFHISMLKKYIRDEGHIIPDYKELNIQVDTTYGEETVKILHRQNKVLRRNIITLVKVL